MAKLVPVPDSTLASGAPLNWPVYQNSFDNIERLGLWTGGTNPLPNPTNPNGDPSGCFATVAPNSLGGGANPPTIYVLAHGWAPGYRDAVLQQSGHLLWWDKLAAVNGAWTSNWAWTGVDAKSVAIEVNATGLLQSIVAQDPKAIVLAYSWIDDSATDSGVLNLTEVYRSEAYTHINGLRLAGALQQAIAPSFWTKGGRLRLIGHSHGSKVVTVAATTLQQSGLDVAHLTILDAPESDVTLEANAANLLGYYLAGMQIVDPSGAGASGAFIDNYASCFGVGYSAGGSVQNVIETTLAPGSLYDATEISERHAYAAAWYGGAAAGARAQGEAPLGLAWPPAPALWQPALNQIWTSWPNEAQQWSLSNGPSIGSVFSYGLSTFKFLKTTLQGAVRFDATHGAWIFGPGASPTNFSFLQGKYQSTLGDEAYGLAVDIDWTDPQAGDYLVFTVENPISLNGAQEVVAVLDGRSQAAGATSIAIASAVWSDFSDLTLYVFFCSSGSSVSVSNFRFITVASVDGRLQSRRLAEARRRSKLLALQTPACEPAA